jgi:hypothetical protein
MLVDGNPLEDLSLLAEPEDNLMVIMKDGAIVPREAMMTIMHVCRVEPATEQEAKNAGSSRSASDAARPASVRC